MAFGAPRRECALPEPAHSVTELLQAWRGGDETALGEVAPLVYGELRRLAAGYLRREEPGHTLQPTALIHEAFLRLMGQQGTVDWESRTHFVAIAAQLMRQILVDHARKRQSAKRGGRRPLSLEGMVVADIAVPDLLLLETSLQDLARMDPRKCRMVELRYFGGLELQEIADLTHVHVNTVRRDLRVALSWLKANLGA